MSNLSFSDHELDIMESQPDINAMRIGKTIPYHLAYAQTHRNSILNPRLPGKRPEAAHEKGATDNETD